MWLRICATPKVLLLASGLEDDAQSVVVSECHSGIQGKGLFGQIARVQHGRSVLGSNDDGRVGFAMFWLDSRRPLLAMQVCCTWYLNSPLPLD